MPKEKEPEINTQIRKKQIMQGLGTINSVGTWVLGKLNSIRISEKSYYAPLTNEEKRFMFDLTMDDSVELISKDFASNARHLRTMRLSESLTEIPEGAFEDCEKLRLLNNFKNMKKLTAIRENAFANTNLREIPALDKLMFIENGAFADCSHLRYLNFSENSNIRVIGDNAFDGCKRLVDQKKAIFGGRGKFDLPKKLEVLGEGAFGGCKKIKKLEIGSSVRQINGNPFASPTCDYKKNGKMKLGARWRNWHSKIYIDGIMKPLRGKYFEGMDTTIDGLRHIQYNGRHHVEIEKGKFAVFDNKQYKAWQNQKADELVSQVQVTPESFVAYIKEKTGIEISPKKVSVADLNAFNRGKDETINISFGGKHEQLPINVLDIKDFTSKWNQQQCMVDEQPTAEVTPPDVEEKTNEEVGQTPAPQPEVEMQDATSEATPVEEQEVKVDEPVADTVEQEQDVAETPTSTNYIEQEDGAWIFDGVNAERIDSTSTQNQEEEMVR